MQGEPTYRALGNTLGMIQALLLICREYILDTGPNTPLGPSEAQTRQFCRIRVWIVSGQSLGVLDPGWTTTSRHILRLVS